MMARTQLGNELRRLAENWASPEIKGAFHDAAEWVDARLPVICPDKQHPFEFGDKVMADCDPAMPMTVIAIMYVPDHAVSVKCAYWCNGDHKELWIDSWRLKKWEK